MRRSFLTAAIGLTLLLPAAAQAKTASASAGGVTATLTYATDVAGPATTTGQVLVITEHGKTVYQQQPPNTGCYKACTPIGKHPVQLASLYGNDGEDVVLTLWSGGADCCTRADVYVPSAALGSYVLDQRNFGEAGFALRDIGPSGRPLFVSANNAYYCSITICAGSALPLQIFEFEAERFVDVTRAYPQLIAKDADRWLKLYYKHPAQGEGAIAAWAADDYLLGSKYKATVNTVLQLQYADHHLSNSFVKSLDKLLAKQP